MILFLMLIVTLLFCNFYALINIFRYVRYFTFLFHNDSHSLDKQVSYAEFCRLMKKK